MIADLQNGRDFETTLLQIAELAGLDTTNPNLTTSEVLEKVRDIRISYDAAYNEAIEDACEQCEDNDNMREALAELRKGFCADDDEESAEE